jgi:hypothetical protein
MKRSTIAKASVALAAGAMLMGSAATAQAQPYGYNGASSGYSYDPCKREKTGRATGGALLGGAIGAVIGSQAAARGHRTDGSLLGGALGAAIGAGVGSSAAACANGQTGYYEPAPRYDSYSRYGSGYGSTYGGGYYGRDSYAPAYRYEGRYDDSSWAYGRRGERYRMAQGRGVDADGCTLAESPIHMPDGRVETRFVRVCRDSSGRYAVVD